MAKKRKTLGASSESHRRILRMDASSARDAAKAAVKYAENGVCSTAFRYLTDAAHRIGSVETSLAAMARGKKRNADYEAAGLAKADLNKALNTVISKCSR